MSTSHKLSDAKVKCLTFSMLTLFFTAFTFSNIYLNPTLLYISILLISISHVIVLAKSRRVSDIIYVITILSLYYPLYHIITGSFDILTWDHKAMENVAEHTLLSGRIPSSDIANPQLRSEYTSYPIAFIEWSITSLITSLTTDQVMRLPILTIPLYLVVICTISVLIKEVRTNNEGDTLTPLGTVLVSVFLLLNILHPFVYQSYGRVLLLLCIAFMLRFMRGNKSNSVSTVITMVILGISLIMSHSESSVAFLIYVLSLTISATISKSSARRINAWYGVIIFTVIAFTLHHLWLSSLFGKQLLEMLYITFTYALREEEPLLRYTPLDYSTIDLLLLLIGALSVISILVYSLISLMVSVIKGKSKAPLTLVPIITMAFVFIFLFLFSPYKSDISLKFLYSLSMITLLFLYERAISFKNEAKWRINLKTVLILALLALSMSGSLVLKGVTRSYTLDDLMYRRDVVIHLGTLSQPIIESLKHECLLVIVDSPSLPYFFIRDYIAPRVPVNYKVMLLEPNEMYYEIVQLNGLRLPRFILLNPELHMFNLNDIEKKIIICNINDSKHFCERLPIVLNSGKLLLIVA